MSRFSPVQIGLTLVALLVVVLLIVFFNPWTGFLRGQVADARADEETAVDGQVGLEAAAEGQAVVEAEASEVRIIVEQARGVAHAVEIQARAAPGGNTPLADTTVARLRQSDDILCGLRPGVCTGRADGVAPETDDPD